MRDPRLEADHRSAFDPPLAAEAGRDSSVQCEGSGVVAEASLPRVTPHAGGFFEMQELVVVGHDGSIGHRIAFESAPNDSLSSRQAAEVLGAPWASLRAGFICRSNARATNTFPVESERALDDPRAAHPLNDAQSSVAFDRECAE